MDVISSSQTEGLDVYLQAELALKGFVCKPTHLPFNTLQQYLIQSGATAATESDAILLFPWDICPALDWRSGIASTYLEIDQVLSSIDQFFALIDQSKGQLFYFNAELPPICKSHDVLVEAQNLLLAACYQRQFKVFDQSYFSLTGYLEFGTPIAGNKLSDVAFEVSRSFTRQSEPTVKVLVTDLDNVMWDGVIGEDGIDAIEYMSKGKGFKHFLYQGYLKQLKESGSLLAIASKNDPDLADLPFKQGDMLLDLDDFVTSMASYNPKSAQIKKLSEEINLPASSFVFVDDNPIELEEVSRAIPEINTVHFPANNSDIIDFFKELSSYFNKSTISADDQERTKLYKTRLLGMAPAESTATDLVGFLEQLEMKLTIYDRSENNSERAVQLINKTNQFNINGHRLDLDQIDVVLSQGGRLYSAKLVDKHGDHGEILACLIDKDNRLLSLVLSCRVFQRKVEHTFLLWLIQSKFNNEKDISLDYVKTERNTPVSLFLKEQLFIVDNTGAQIDCAQFIEANQSLSKLIELTVDESCK